MKRQSLGSALIVATILAATVLAASALSAQSDESDPLAPELLAARKIFVKQTLIDPKIVSRFRSELGKLERFEIAATAEEADLVATLAAAAEYTHTVADSGSADMDPDADESRASSTGLRPMGTVRVLEDLHLLMVLPDGTEVWADSVPIGSLTGNAAKKLVKRLAERLEEEG